MSFIYELKTYSSVKNGEIKCVRALGKWHILVNGTGQTSPYVTTMWKKALKYIPKKAHIKNILILGLGAGGQINTIHKKFFHPNITAIEWDPVMVDIAKDLRIFNPNHHPRVIVQDAVAGLKTLHDTFDLVLVDLFTGSKPTPSLCTVSFIKSIAEKLKPNGFLLLNVFRTPALLDTFDQVLSREKNWRFQYNTLALYCHRGSSASYNTPPQGYISHKQSLTFLKGGGGESANKEIVGEKGNLGLRWNYGPFYFESYESDTQPCILPFHKPRLIIWQPFSNMHTPRSWHRSWIQMNTKCNGIAIIKDLKHYWENWTSHAKRHRNKWLKDQRYHITEISPDEFSTDYLKNSHLPFLKKLFVNTINQHKKVNSDLVHLFAARDIKTQENIAGLAVLDMPDIHQSLHLVSFISPRAKNTSAGVGLIDHWFSHAIDNSLQFLNFGNFWTAGEPKSWQGFSQFKSQFGIYFIIRPNAFIRVVRKNRT